ncbi:helix-turn-helix domain-containing protein [Myroides marinus]|uniref:AraC family transcriptional regulator n=1 Tax=Myroides marinus TaxID=703342 RepID=A0A161UT84_9FLAO|nr:helix-turn-helix domain-containing protein [Myroides marinus]KZE80941.1 AraC family transcriptional regulator [Myroides marinus]MDM1346073.1 helix-turn-helix domain-containing protein [Myroides marinus]MDM1350875.1 helix-turn-helix domain-containing protein [Myroides marinus]MDM1353327.1 helix-turn-helix domain-containing protein [Myroides marinus]MDM1358082.1 helix-turn-helix domain-containing protein [Myroides marinus]
MIDKEKEIREIETIKEFKEHFLVPEDSSCEECSTLRYKEGAGYMEVLSLADLRQRDDLFLGSRTRKRFYSMVLITKGEVTEMIGPREYQFKEQTMYFISDNQLHQIKEWTEDLEGIMCLFDSDYFLLCLKHQIKLNSFPFFQMDQPPFVKLNEREVEMMRHLFWKLNQEQCQKETFNDDLLVRMFLNIILIEAERIYNKQSSSTPFVLTRKEQLVAKYQLLVTQKAIELKQVSQYADLLNVHPHYLNDVVKEVSNQPASYFIHKHLIEESKSRLIQTNATVSQIAIDLNFTEESYFGRFFKKKTGVTPLQYRKQHKQH